MKHPETTPPSIPTNTATGPPAIGPVAVPRLMSCACPRSHAPHELDPNSLTSCVRLCGKSFARRLNCDEICEPKSQPTATTDPNRKITTGTTAQVSRIRVRWLNSRARPRNNKARRAAPKASTTTSESFQTAKAATPTKPSTNMVCANKEAVELARFTACRGTTKSILSCSSFEFREWCNPPPRYQAPNQKFLLMQINFARFGAAYLFCERVKP